MADKINITPVEQKILDALANAPAGDYTLAEISEMVGVELKSGNINALVNKKGKLECHKDAREVEYTARKKVATYSLVK